MLAPGTLTRREAARPPVSDSASPRVSPSARQGLGHRVLDGLVVDAEHDVAGRLGEDPTDGRLVAVEGRFCRRPRRPTRTVTRTLMPSMPLARKAMVAVLPDPSAAA